MKKLFLSLFGVAALVLGGLFSLAISSQSQSPHGVTPGETLALCPDRPNCVSSVEGDVEPFLFTGSVEEAWSEIKAAVEDVGGELQKQEGTYLAAVFKSPFFGFVDDVEFRMIPDQKLIHVRSASRVGYSDMGANEERVEKLRELFN